MEDRSENERDWTRLSGRESQESDDPGGGYIEKPVLFDDIDDRRETPTYTEKPSKKRSFKNGVVSVLATVVTLVLMAVMVFNAPIIRYEKQDGDAVTVQQLSILNYWRAWQPLVEEEGELSKVSPEDSSKLDLRSDVEQESRDDGLDLNQTIEGQYTLLFLGMDESEQLSDVNWIFQFDLIAGTLHILQIPRDCFMPDYAYSVTGKLNSIYASGQETGVTPIQRVVNALEESFCLSIDSYVKLNCEDIPEIVDSVGGIPITLPETIYYEADKVLQAGEQTLNGEQAEWFVRFRHGYDEGDIGRVKAQRIFLAAAMQKLLDMSQTQVYATMANIYNHRWIATDLSLAEIGMLADYSSNRLSLESVDVFVVPGEGANYYPTSGGVQAVYSIHKNATVDLLNESFRPYQNEIYPEQSAIVELIPEGQYFSTNNDNTRENLDDVHDGRTEDGAQ